MPTSPLQLSAAELLKLYEKKKFSPVAAVESCLKQILKYNPVLNAFSYLDEQAALHQAKASERRWQKGAPKGLLDGVPVTVKDSFNVKGWPTRQGSKTMAALPQRDDAPAVTYLRDQGAIILGKTTMPEFGVKGVTDSPLWGITRNPWNVKKTPGGSSGGAAVAAATGMAWLNLGSDAGGSVRIPASFSGVVGFKPSQGLVPALPPGLFSTLWAAGPVVRSIADAALMMDVVTGNDPRDWFSLPMPAQGFVAALGKPLPKLRIAYATSIDGLQASGEVKEIFARVIPHLKKLGTAEEVKLGLPHGGVEVFNTHWMAVAAHTLAEFPEKSRKLMDPRFLNWAKRGQGLLLKDYLWAERARMDIGAYFKELLSSYDILVTPTTAMTAFDAGTDMPNDAKGQPWDNWTPFTLPANLARLPALSIPMGMTKDGLPAGLQIMAGYLRDPFLLRTGAALEEAIGFTPWLEAKKEG